MSKEIKEPKCKTCGESGKIQRKEKQHCRLRLCADLTIPSCFRCQFYIHEKPCPDCTEQPPAGEFTRRARLIATHCPSKPRTPMEKCILEACTRLDRSEASRKDLLTACRQAFNESHNPKVEKTLKAAIAKEKEVKI